MAQRAGQGVHLDAFDISQGEKSWRARLLCAKQVATDIRERVWHRSQRLRERQDGSLDFVSLQTWLHLCQPAAAVSSGTSGAILGALGGWARCAARPAGPEAKGVRYSPKSG